MPRECAWLSAIRVRQKGNTEEQREVTINVNILKSCEHCRFLYGCKNKLPSLNQETLDIWMNWVVAKRQRLFTRLHSQTESLGHNPILLKTSNCLRDLPAETLWFYFSWHKILHYFLSVLELWLSIFNPKQQKQPTHCILGWYNTDCLQDGHLNSLHMHCICYSKCYCKVECF